MKPRLSLLAPLLLLACSSPPPPAAPPAPAAAPPPSAAPVAPVEVPSARVMAVAPSKDDTAYVRAKIVFANPTRGACRVLGYKLLWAGKSKAITLQDLALPPGETRERWLKVNPDDGDLAALTPESARVEVKMECSP